MDAGSSVKGEELICPVTQELMVDPQRLNCVGNHSLSGQAAQQIFGLMRDGKCERPGNCPLCRVLVTSYAPDLQKASLVEAVMRVAEQQLPLPSAPPEGDEPAPQSVFTTPLSAASSAVESSTEPQEGPQVLLPRLLMEIQTFRQFCNEALRTLQIIIDGEQRASSARNEKSGTDESRSGLWAFASGVCSFASALGDNAARSRVNDEIQSVWRTFEQVNRLIGLLRQHGINISFITKRNQGPIENWADIAVTAVSVVTEWNSSFAERNKYDIQHVNRQLNRLHQNVVGQGQHYGCKLGGQLEGEYPECCIL